MLIGVILSASVIKLFLKTYFFPISFFLICLWKTTVLFSPERSYSTFKIKSAFSWYDSLRKLHCQLQSNSISKWIQFHPVTLAWGEERGEEKRTMCEREQTPQSVFLWTHRDTMVMSTGGQPGKDVFLSIISSKF